MAFTLINLAKDSALQGQLLAEIRAKEKEKGYSVGEYVAKQDTLLHFATLESMRVTPAMCMFFFLISCFYLFFPSSLPPPVTHTRSFLHYLFPISHIPTTYLTIQLPPLSFHPPQTHPLSFLDINHQSPQ
jgi:hypothetical protein